MRGQVAPHPNKLQDDRPGHPEKDEEKGGSHEIGRSPAEGLGQVPHGGIEGHCRSGMAGLMAK